jgi:opacity protein-like surface antigen
MFNKKRFLLVAALVTALAGSATAQNRVQGVSPMYNGRTQESYRANYEQAVQQDRYENPYSQYRYNNNYNYNRGNVYQRNQNYDNRYYRDGRYNDGRYNNRYNSGRDIQIGPVRIGI